MTIHLGALVRGIISIIWFIAAYSNRGSMTSLVFCLIIGTIFAYLAYRSYMK